MPKIAISYRRADTDAITGRIFDRLVTRYGRESVFRDIDNIPIGVDFRAHINTVLDKSDVVLVIVGSRWAGGRGAQNRLGNAADPVRIEVETALRRGTPIVPVLVGRIEMPKVEQLPDSLADFAYRNGVRVDPGQDFDLHMGRLIGALDGIAATTSASDRSNGERQTESSASQLRAASTPIIKSPPARRRLAAAGGGALLLIAAGLSLWVVTRREQEQDRRPEIIVAAPAGGETKALEQPATALPAARPEAEAKAERERAVAAEAARREAAAKAEQERAAAVEAARREAEARARQQQAAANVPALYRELRRAEQPEVRDAAGKITVEAATIHVLSCDGPGGNGAQIWLYEYAHRPTFRAIAPPNWGTPLGGRDFEKFADAAAAGCGRLTRP